ncbi:MAG: GGDEF domain-containing protein [Hydrogenothermaceae bacterium]|nr:GGDEF domain-containing protein [Hydrogenothermaceae bacterium]
MPVKLYESFKSKVKEEEYIQNIESLKKELENLSEEFLQKVKQEENFLILNDKQKSILEKFLNFYLKSILTTYPTDVNIRKIYRASRKLDIEGIPDLLIVDLYNRMKSLFEKRNILTEILQLRIDVDLLAILRHYTLLSLDLERKISDLAEFSYPKNSDFKILDELQKAKKEYIRIKNRVIKAIMNGNKNIEVKTADQCKFALILSNIQIIGSKNLSEIRKMHTNFHSFIDFFLKNIDGMSSSKKYLLIKELESLSLRILYLLNEIQIELTSRYSFLDRLTESYNKNIFPIIFQREVKRAERYNFSISILIIDIDDFKDVNDNYGHLIGDEILKEISRIIRKNTRESDYLFRFGGEEFILLLPHTPLENAMKVGEKIRQKIEKHSFTEKNLNITISCGITEVKNFQNPYLNLEDADKMLYISKRSGKNRCTIYRESV